MRGGDCLIVRRCGLLRDICESSDFKVDVVYATPQFITICTPQSNRRQAECNIKLLTEISDMFGFSSEAYFCRYVQKYLGGAAIKFYGINIIPERISHKNGNNPRNLYNAGFGDYSYLCSLYEKDCYIYNYVGYDNSNNECTRCAE